MSDEEIRRVALENARELRNWIDEWAKGIAMKNPWDCDLAGLRYSIECHRRDR